MSGTPTLLPYCKRDELIFQLSRVTVDSVMFKKLSDGAGLTLRRAQLDVTERFCSIRSFSGLTGHSSLCI